MAGDRLHLFYLRSGFEYFFVRCLIDHLGLRNVLFLMHQPREGVDVRAATEFRVISSRGRFLPGWLGKKTSKLVFALSAFREAGLADADIRFYSPVYNETCVNALRELMRRYSRNVSYALIPDGAALLRDLPRPSRKRRLRWLERFYGIEPADTRHTSGVHSDFIDTIYHFPATGIEGPPEKIEIVPVPISRKENNGRVLVIGGLGGVTERFTRDAIEEAGSSPVLFRMHPRNRNGLEHIQALAPEWRELERLEGSLEEHLLEDPYRRVMGPFSTALMFNHLFVSGSESCFLIDEAARDPDWERTADACGIPVIRLD